MKYFCLVQAEKLKKIFYLEDKRCKFFHKEGDRERDIERRRTRMRERGRMRQIEIFRLRERERKGEEKPTTD